MMRTRGMLVLLAVLSGTATAVGGPFMSQYWSTKQTQNQNTDDIRWGPQFVPEVPTVQGAYGEPISMAAPYNMKPPTGADAARAMIARSQPLDLVQQSGYFRDGGMPVLPVAGQYPGAAQQGGMPMPPGMMPPGNMLSPPGVAATPPGALPPGLRPPGAVAAVGALTGAPQPQFPIQRTEVRFVGPPGMKISWYGPTADGRGGFGPQFLEAPARYNFLQASIYRLKLSDIPNRPGMELYPTLEVVPAKAKTCTFLAHSAVPIAFTEEDLEQVAAGNFVVKVIYLPDPQFQDLAATGPDEVVSSRLEPGMDPIVEAKRRGSILLVVRLGNIDLEAPNTPSMDAPNPFACPPGHPPAAPGLPPAPGVPLAAGAPGIHGMAPQMGPGLPPRPPMMPYGMIGGPPAAGGADTPQNSGPITPGQMLPTVPGMPGAPGNYPVGTQPGTPLGKAAPSGNGVQQASFPSTAPSPTSTAPSSASPRQPTLAELAGRPSGSH
jgi:hypothetical protein